MNRFNKAVMFGLLMSLFALVPMGLKADDTTVKGPETKTELARYYHHHHYRGYRGSGIYFYYGSPYYYNYPYYDSYYYYPNYRYYYYY